MLFLGFVPHSVLSKSPLTALRSRTSYVLIWYTIIIGRDLVLSCYLCAVKVNSISELWEYLFVFPGSSLGFAPHSVCSSRGCVPCHEAIACPCRGTRKYPDLPSWRAVLCQDTAQHDITRHGRTGYTSGKWTEKPHGCTTSRYLSTLALVLPRVVRSAPYSCKPTYHIISAIRTSLTLEFSQRLCVSIFADLLSPLCRQTRWLHTEKIMTPKSLSIRP